jgi:hypothetical protein
VKTARVDESSNSPWAEGYNSTIRWTGRNYNNTLLPPTDPSATPGMEYVGSNSYLSTDLENSSSAYPNDEGMFRGSSSLRYNTLTSTSSSSSTEQTQSDQSTSYLSLPSRKRPFDVRSSYLGDTDRQEAKSRRTTPSSNTTGFSSPPVNQISLGDTGYSSPAYGYDSDIFLDATAGSVLRFVV